jgi:LL-diaminopimelate aminotransferase
MARFQLANRLKGNDGHFFVKIEKKIAERRARGQDVISLAMGSPDGATPPPIVEAIVRAAQDPRNAPYPPFAGKPAFRDAVAAWNKKRFGVEVNPANEVAILAGTAEAPTMLALAFINPGDTVLAQNPLFPLYLSAVRFAGGDTHSLPINPGNDFFPDFDAVPQAIAQKAKILFLNYPHNPTGAVATLDQLRAAVAFAQKNDLILVYDNAYSEITFDGFRAPSILQIEGAKEVAIEFNSFSKTFNMAGWRVGYAIGNAEIIAGLSAAVNGVDTRVPGAIQDGAVEALLNGDSHAREIAAIYEARRNAALDAFARIGWNAQRKLGTFYMWESVPSGFTSEDFALALFDVTGVVVTPGSAFGSEGEGFFRIALVLPEAQIVEAIKRIGDFLAQRAAVPAAAVKSRKEPI